MDRYLEVAAAPAARSLLACAWSRRVDGASEQVTRVVPDGCVDLIWFRGGGALLVAGPDTRAHLSRIAPGEVVGVRFRTGCSVPGLGVAADALRDGRVDLRDVWSAPRADRLGAALAGTSSTAHAQRVLAAAVLGGARGAPDPAVPSLVRLARGGARVGAMADSLGLTERQLHRRCLAAFGYSAKVLQRVLRFSSALDLARRGTPLADVAHRAGYADQAHLSREVRALAGVPLTELLRPAGRRPAAS